MKLIDFLKSSGMRQIQFAEQIGENLSCVNKYCLGTRIPRPETMRKIYNATRGAVTPNDFYFSTAAERCPPPSAEEGDSHV